MISAILLTIMRDNSYGLDALSCLTQLALFIAGFTFVDDTDIINETKSVNTKGEELLVQQQHVVDTWEESLNVTGVLYSLINHIDICLTTNTVMISGNINQSNNSQGQSW